MSIRNRFRDRLAAAANRALMKLYRLPLAAIYAGKAAAHADKSAAQSMLVIRGDGGIGDFVLFLGSLAAIRRHYAGKRLTLLVGRESADLAVSFANVDEVISFDVRRYRLDLAYRLRLIRKLRSKKFDIAINPIYSREPLTDEILYCSGAKESIAFDGNFDNIDAQTKAINNSHFTRVIGSHTGQVSEIERNREFVSKLTGTDQPLEESLPRITLSRRQIQQARDRLIEEGVDPELEPFIVLFPGASTDIKRWPSERFAALANKIVETYRVRIAICGGPADISAQEAVGSLAPSVIRLAGKTDLVQLVAILKHAVLYLGNDTGPLHLAAAVGTPTLCILGGGHFGRFYPYGDPKVHRAVFHELDCFHCNWVCPYSIAHCIHEITVKEVWQAVQQMLGEVQPAQVPNVYRANVLGAR